MPIIPVLSRYTVRIVNASRVVTRQVTGYKKLSIVKRFNAVSDWAIELDAASADAALLTTPGYGIAIVRSLEVANTGVVLAATVEIAGPMVDIDRTGKDNTLTVHGRDGLVFLASRVAYPAASANWGTTAYDTQTGAAETVLKHYVSVNAGPGAETGRPVAGLTIATDTATGDTVTGNARFDRLLTKDGTGLLQQVALAGGLGFRMPLVGTNYQFQTYVPVDRSGSVRFSRALGSVLDFHYTRAAPNPDDGGNVVIIGGGGDGTARTLLVGSDTASIAAWWRVEAFRDARDTTDTTVLAQRTLETLLASRQQTTFDAKLAQAAGAVYGLDFFLGDLVTVVVDDVTFVDLVREVDIDLAASGPETITPYIGTPNALLVDDALVQMRLTAQRTASRLAQLESRK